MMLLVLLFLLVIPNHQAFPCTHRQRRQLIRPTSLHQAKPHHEQNPDHHPDPPPTVQRVGWVRGAVIAIPLLCKLAVVLSIKFLMDLIVFPLLFLYRFLMLVQRRVATLFHPNDGYNNATTPSGESR